ncbi:hypothetical protein [Halalkalibacillus sediminis]|uniref:hypothetical protein n=1 Tax=Halalkalibacillus sediminis TaxID=2018042 RepID=UPI00139050E0|nr:hypothetical protein [Halalkalibacillus sediminis]
MSHNFRWIVNEYRQDRRTGATNPIETSEYAKQLFKNPAGWKDDENETKRN